MILDFYTELISLTGMQVQVIIGAIQQIFTDILRLAVHYFRIMISVEIKPGKDFIILASLQFLNYYSANWNLGLYTETFNNNRTRGGPLTLNPAGYETTLSLSSDSRKDWVVSVGAGTFSFDPSYDWFTEVSLELRLMPNLSFILSPLYQKTL